MSNYQKCKNMEEKTLKINIKRIIIKRPFTERQNGGEGMTSGDVILKLVEMLLSEKEKNTKLMKDNEKSKDSGANT